MSVKATNILRGLYSAVYQEIRRGVRAEWEYANLSADAMITSLFGKGVMEDNHFARWFARNQEAMDSFFSRKDVHGGLNLSQKVWKYTGQFKEEMELALSVSLGQGDSASTVSRHVRQYLREPDRLFRRVRDAQGNLKLSKRAAAYHPGRGEYRSSYKNAMRLTRTETNMAYRAADCDRWSRIPFVVGMEVKRSNHPFGCEVCEALKGKYPKDFVFTGWHPQCRCYIVPVLASEEERMAYHRAVLNGEYVSDFHFKGEITEPHEGFRKWMSDNAERIENARSLPYWMRDNGKYVGFESLFRNKMALQHTEIIGTSELTTKELNQLSGNIRELSRKAVIFGKDYEIEFSEFSDGTLMQWKDGKLTISTVRHQLEDGTVFCPAENLQSAIKKLQKGNTLDFYEEYSIESLFHESVHARATRKSVIIAGSMDEKIMETCTQLYARDRYVKILKAYKVEAVNFERIMTDGLGYNSECSKLRGFFVKNGELQVGELINIANETESGTRIMMKKLMGMGLKEEDAENVLLKMRMN